MGHPRDGRRLWQAEAERFPRTPAPKRWWTLQQVSVLLALGSPPSLKQPLPLDTYCLHSGIQASESDGTGAGLGFPTPGLCDPGQVT